MPAPQSIRAREERRRTRETLARAKSNAALADQLMAEYRTKAARLEQAAVAQSWRAVGRRTSGFRSPRTWPVHGESWKSCSNPSLSTSRSRSNDTGTR